MNVRIFLLQLGEIRIVEEYRGGRVVHTVIGTRGLVDPRGAGGSVSRTVNKHLLLYRSRVYRLR
jgi:hypothetical protein